MNSETDMPLGRLLGNACRLHAKRLDQNMEHLGLFRGQAILLIMLMHHDGMTHSEIAERLEISPAAATKVIKRLEELNYLRRRPDPSDERISRVYMLADGWAITHKIQTVFQRMNQLMVTDFTPEEQAALRALLLRVHANLQEEEPTPVSE